MNEQVSAVALRPRRRRRIPSRPAIHLDSVSIVGLFGKLNYPMLKFGDFDSSRSRVSVIHGDNGTGKTTILRLIYACLSPQPRIGLRTLLSLTPFRQFVLRLTDGTIIQVDKDHLIGSYVVTVQRAGRREEFNIEADAGGTVVGSGSVTALETRVSRLGLDVLFVDHNRVVQSTFAFVSESSEEDLSYVPSDVMEVKSFSRDFARSVRRHEEADLRVQLPAVLEALETRFRTEAYRQGAAGEQSAAGVYLDIVKSLNRDRRRADEREDLGTEDIPSELDRLKLTTRSFVSHGLFSEYPFEDLAAVYNQASRPKKRQITAALRPFLDSVERRIAALGSIDQQITTFETELARYLTKKEVAFHTLFGLSINDGTGELEIDDLSSGERQLIFLLAAAAVARPKRSIILIDEPELSLNYKWQRLIAGSLANVSAGSETQYLLASHSIEIISRHVNSAIELEA